MTDIRYLPTTDHETTIDSVITNVNLSELVYELLISDHRSIFLTGVDTYMQTRNNTGVEDDDNMNKIMGNNIVQQINNQAQTNSTYNDVFDSKQFIQKMPIHS